MGLSSAGAPNNWGKRFGDETGNLERESISSWVNVSQWARSLPGNADNKGGDNHGSIGKLDPLHPKRWGSCEKCDKPRRRLSDFSCRRHLARRFWNQTWAGERENMEHVIRTQCQWRPNGFVYFLCPCSVRIYNLCQFDKYKFTGGGLCRRNCCRRANTRATWPGSLINPLNMQLNSSSRDFNRSCIYPARGIADQLGLACVAYLWFDAQGARDLTLCTLYREIAGKQQQPLPKAIIIGGDTHIRSGSPTIPLL